MAVFTYRDALTQALREELARDESVFLMGEEVAQYNGAYKVSKGLLDEFGPMRIVDTPITELGFAGIGVGSAMVGLRPIIEFMTWNFALLALDQVVNAAAKMLYMSGGQFHMPMVFRGPNGSALQLSAQHSQAWESWLAHIPGLKVVTPGTPADAKGLLKAAIRDPNPVIYFEHKFLYRRIKAVLPTEDYIVPIGKAEVKRIGSTISVITYGAMVHLALEAATVLEKEDIQLEVVDLRTLIPLDKETIYESVRKTSKAIMLHEDNKTGGIGAEIAALLAEDCFDSLDGPVLRVAAPDTPVPFSTPMEEFFLPKVSDVVAAARTLAAY